MNQPSGIYELTDFPDLGTVWSHLQQEQGHPLLNWSFIEPVVRHFADQRLAIACGENGDWIALVQRDDRLRWQIFKPSQLPIAPILSRQESFALSAVLDQTSGPTPLALTSFGLDDRYLERREDTATTATETFGTTISIENVASFEEYWAGRKKKLRDNIKRYNKKALQDYEIKLVVDSCAPEMASGVEAYAQLECQGWKGREGTALEPGNTQCQLYTEILQGFAQQSGGLVFRLYFDDLLVASRLAISQGETAVFLKTTYLESQSSLSPGRIMLHLAIEELLDRRGIKTVEFYTKADANMMAWGTSAREIHHATVFRNSIIARLHRLKSKISD